MVGVSFSFIAVMVYISFTVEETEFDGSRVTGAGAVRCIKKLEESTAPELVRLEDGNPCWEEVLSVAHRVYWKHARVWRRNAGRRKFIRDPAGSGKKISIEQVKGGANGNIAVLFVVSRATVEPQHRMYVAWSGGAITLQHQNRVGHSHPKTRKGKRKKHDKRRRRRRRKHRQMHEDVHAKQQSSVLERYVLTPDVKRVLNQSKVQDAIVQWEPSIAEALASTPEEQVAFQLSHIDSRSRKKGKIAKELQPKLGISCDGKPSSECSRALNMALQQTHSSIQKSSKHVALCGGDAPGASSSEVLARMSLERTFSSVCPEDKLLGNLLKAGQLREDEHVYLITLARPCQSVCWAVNRFNEGSKAELHVVGYRFETEAELADPPKAADR